MNALPPLNPAEKAAEDARLRINECIDANYDFLVEAGAGAGKTYSLVEALNYVIETRGQDLLRRSQKVACITYTNVATDEINDRTDRHPAIQTSTIHSFCWSIIQNFQPFLRQALPDIVGWSERLTETDGVGDRMVVYDLGHPKITDDSISLHHNDVIFLTLKLFEQPKFRQIVAERYPILFIDEYQDTDRGFAECLKTYFIGRGKGPLVGFFGDHWQKIYGNGCGKIEHPELAIIGKNCNFRSVQTIVDCLNNMRPSLPQFVQDPMLGGTVAVYHTNSWPGVRRTGQHWGGDLPAEQAHACLNRLRTALAADGWEFSPEKTKILMLTHKVLAAEQGYPGIEEVFEYNDSFIKKEDPHIAFFCDIIEPACAAFEQKHYGKMFEVLSGRTPRIKSLADKKRWTDAMNQLLVVRSKGTVGTVVDCLKATGRPRLPDAVETREEQLATFLPDANTEEPTSLVQLKKLREVSYREVASLAQFIK